MTYEFNKYRPEWHKGLEDLVSKPKIVGYFSVDGDRNYLPDSSRLLYYKPLMTKNVYLDLNKGIESAIRKAPEENGRINHLLEWIKLNHADIQAPGNKSWIEPKFVCSAGFLTDLMCTPVTLRVGWTVYAAKWKGTIYMYTVRTEEKLRISVERLKKTASWGFKFKQYVLSDAPDKDPDTSKPVVESAEFRCMFQRRFGDHSVLFSADLDALYSKTALKDPLPLNDLRFIQLKTCRRIETTSQERNFRKFRLLRWWAQSFLVDNEKLLCAFRDDYGIVQNLKSYSLPEMVETSKQFWDPVSSVNACTDFLNHVAETVVDDCDKAIYKFEKKSDDDVVTTEKVSPQSDFAFVPLSYLAATG